MARKLCTSCGLRAVGTGGGEDAVSARSLDECNPCYTLGGWENSHSDNGHDGIQAVIENKGTDGLSSHETDEISVMAGCWVCHPELNLADKPHTPRKVGERKQGTRRAQLNHKGHSHQQSPSERRACKELFWATRNGTDPQTWDAHIDRETGKMVAGGRVAKPAAKRTRKAKAQPVEAPFVCDWEGHDIAMEEHGFCSVCQ